MTPDTPGTPDEGKPDVDKVGGAHDEVVAAGDERSEAGEAKDAKAKTKPAAKKAAKKPAAEKKAPAEKKPAAKKAPAKKKGEAEAAKTPTAKRTKEKLADEADDTAAKKTGTDKKGAEAAKKPATASSKKPAPTRARGAKQPTGELVVVRAQARYVRSSARKARLVCDHIRGKDVAQARAILAYSPRHVAEAWSKLLESAVANAENNHDLNGEDLVIQAVHADEGPTIKRFRPRAMGRATRIRKRTSHLSIALTSKEN